MAQETLLVGELNPVWREFYLAPLRESGLSVYAKEINLDGWIRGIDIFLVYDSPEELEQANRLIREIDAEREL